MRMGEESQRPTLAGTLRRDPSSRKLRVPQDDEVQKLRKTRKVRDASESLADQFLDA